MESTVFTGVKPYWSQDGLTIYCGDCIDVMARLGSDAFNAVVTDPPFAFAGGISNGLSSRADSQFFTHWLKDVFRQMHRVSTPESAWFLWGDWRTVSVYDDALRVAAIDYHDQRSVSQVIIHDREMVGMGSPFRNQLDWIALVRGKKTDFGDRVPKNQPNIIRDYWYYGKHTNHPAEKSVKVARSLIEWISDAGQVIFDPFMGSGTTLVAARESGRQGVGIELDEQHCEQAVKRLAQSVLTLDLAS